MKKLILTALFLCSCAVILFAQGLTQNAEGKSSILFKGSSATVDISESKVSFGINNLIRALQLSKKKDNYKWVYGVDLSATSEEGFRDIFNAGDLVPAAEANVFTGISISNTYIPDDEKLKQTLDDSLVKLIHDQALEFKSDMELEIAKRIDSNSQEGKKAIKTFTAALKQGNTKRFINKLSSYKTDDESIKTVIEDLIEIAREDENQFDIAVQAVPLALKKQFKSHTIKNLRILTSFVFGGVNALSFKRFDTVNTTTLSKSFFKEEFRGGNIGIGLNYRCGLWRFGLTYEYLETNNFDMLDKVEYTLSTKDANGRETLNQNKSITAYSGAYDRIAVNRLNFDAIYTLLLNIEDNFYCYINPYVRTRMFSRNGTQLPNTFNIGTGLYFFNSESKFLGGLYIELPDVENNIEKQKSIVDQNIRPPLKRLTFGVVVKFSISSVLKFQ